MFELLFYIVITLMTVSFIAILAKKQGIELIIGTFVGLIVISNVVANKIVGFWKFSIPAGIIAYSASFLLTDVLVEFYGKKQAKKAVWSGFFASIVSLLIIFIAIKWPSASFWQYQEEFSLVLKNTWRIVLASLVAYLISQNHDVWAFSFWKKKTKSKHLWFRNNASTIVSQAIDSFVFVFIAFYGLFPIIPIMIGLFVAKFLVAILDTPFIYLVRYFYSK